MSLRARHRATKRFLFRADVSQFYHSIYTHSIPWALHTKAVAKLNRGTDSLGNQVDRLLRNCQDQQTIGIPIGPDTSLLVAEMILSGVDTQFATSITGFEGYRYVDDYELCFKTLAEAEAALATLQQVLLEYELRLNPTKTTILELPQPLEPKWSSDLRTFQFRPSTRAEEFDLIRYFDLAFEFAREVPDESVLKYAIARLTGRTVQSDNWELLQSLLWHVAVVEPAAIRDVLGAVLEYEAAGLLPDLTLMEDAVNEVIERHAPLGHDSEVTWALWAILKFGLHITEGAANALSTLDDCFAAILALDARAQGRVGKIDPGLWASYMKVSELYDRQWLLAYEANVRGWLPSLGSGDHVKEDANWAFLKGLGVTFYRPVTPRAKLPRRKRRIIRLAPAPENQSTLPSIEVPTDTGYV